MRRAGLAWVEVAAIEVVDSEMGVGTAGSPGVVPGTGQAARVGVRRDDGIARATVTVVLVPQRSREVSVEAKKLTQTRPVRTNSVNSVIYLFELVQTRLWTEFIPQTTSAKKITCSFQSGQTKIVESSVNVHSGCSSSPEVGVRGYGLLSPGSP